NKSTETLKITSEILIDNEPLWKVKPLIPGSEAYYNFGQFACELNKMELNIAPTDSRHRPDQRLMEKGKWDQANAEKIRLEQKQRAVRKKREGKSCEPQRI